MYIQYLGIIVGWLNVVFKLLFLLGIVFQRDYCRFVDNEVRVKENC